jgi:molecular chaperone DnaK (HSP70)
MTSNGLLSVFEPDGIPPALHGVSQIKYTLKFNANGILKGRFLQEEFTAKDKARCKWIEALNMLSLFVYSFKSQIANVDGVDSGQANEKKCEELAWTILEDAAGVNANVFHCKSV